VAGPVLFTDRDLGRKIPDALSAAGFTVEQHDDHFGPRTPDAVWLREVGARGWLAFSHNKSIRYRSQERDMVMRAGVPLFLLIGAASHDELAVNLVQTMPKVLDLLVDHAPPFVAKIYRPSPVSQVRAGKPGRVELWLDEDRWQESFNRP
jgi:hypothetical protein